MSNSRFTCLLLRGMFQVFIQWQLSPGIIAKFIGITYPTYGKCRKNDRYCLPHLQAMPLNE
jgi:hypothetical protein